MYKCGNDLLVATGSRARALRRRAGINQASFWSRVAVTQSAGSRYESGRTIPLPVQFLLSLAYGSPTQKAFAAYCLGLPTSSFGTSRT